MVVPADTLTTAWRGSHCCPQRLPQPAQVAPRTGVGVGADPGLLTHRFHSSLTHRPSPPLRRSPRPPAPTQVALFFSLHPRRRPTPQSLEDLEDQKRKKKKEKMGFGSISRVFARGKQRKSLDPGLFDGTAPDYYIEEDADW